VSEFTAYYQSLLKAAGSSSTPTLRLFERQGGEYFTAHGDDALAIADEFFSTREVCKYEGASKLAKVNIRPQKLETILKQCLLQNKQNVELHAQREGKWSLSKRASPGNLQSFEDLLFHRSDMADSSIVMAARLTTVKDGKVYGLHIICMSFCLRFFFFFFFIYVFNSQYL
jgi:DNA mismatch repair protein MSH2